MTGVKRGSSPSASTARRLDLLPKAHLHLHFTGSMRRETLIELADKHGIRLPDAFSSDWPPRLSGTDERGWFRFQRLYDIARTGAARARRCPQADLRGWQKTSEPKDQAGLRSRSTRPGTPPCSGA